MRASAGKLCALAFATLFFGTHGGEDARCTDSAASNYDPSTSVDDGSCRYECGSELNLKVGAPPNAKCYLYSDDVWDSALTSKSVGGLFAVVSPAAWVVQGKPLSDGTKLQPRTPPFPYRFNVSSGKDLTVRFATFEDSGSTGSSNKGGSLQLSGGTARLFAVIFTKAASNSQLGGAIYASEGSDVTVTLAIFQESAALTGGAFWAKGSKLYVTNCSFEQTKSLSHGGGGIYAETCDPVEITNSVFDGCKAEDSGGGDALDLTQCNHILVRGTAFQPFDEGKTVHFDTSWLSTVGGCFEHPCGSGFGCTYSNYSVNCKPCPDGTHSTDGITCTPCIAGSGPNEANTECIPCSGTMYSTDGNCVPCNTPNVVSANHDDCHACKPGQQPNADRSGCTSCDPGRYSIFGAQCTQCVEPNVVNGNRTSCQACRAGMGPNADHTQCQPCPAHWANYSIRGVCEACPYPNVVNADHTTCSACPEGKGPAANQLGCSDCKSKRYSTNGLCQLCEASSIVNSEQTTCTPCGPGTHPSTDQTRCQLCTEGYFSDGGGACQPCAAPNVVNADRTKCLPCRAGQGADPESKQCSNCTGQQYSQSGRCIRCILPYIVNTDHSACEPCGAGTQPVLVGQAYECSPCTGATFSKTGASCEKCASPYVVNPPDYTTCTPCESGQGPKTPVNDECVACVGANYSTFGLCQECGSPSVVDDRHTTCRRCLPGQKPNAARNSCVNCTGSSFSSTGASCELCLDPLVVDVHRRSCFPCEAGNGPNADRTQCVECVDANYSIMGVCQPCEYPNIVPPGKSECRRCQAGQGPTPNQKACQNCTGKNEYSARGYCEQCEAGKDPVTDQFGFKTHCQEPFACLRGQFCPTAACIDKNDCKGCPAGTFSDDGKRCRVCDPGKAATKDRSACVRCNGGMEPSLDRDKCVSCSGGTNYSTDNQIACQACLFPNYICVNNESEVCAKREANCKPTDTMQCFRDACLACRPGYQANKDQTGCDRCPPSKISSTTNPTCQECKEHYFPNPDQTLCEKCPPKQQDTGEGKCGCADNYYNASAGSILCFSHGYSADDVKRSQALVSPNDPCQPCPDCAVCTHGRPTLIKAGWKSASAESEAPGNLKLEILRPDLADPALIDPDFPAAQIKMFFACTASDTDTSAETRCPGQQAGITMLENGTFDDNNAVGTSFGTEGCADRYTGFFCQSCTEFLDGTQAIRLHKSSSDGLCGQCQSQRAQAWVYGGIFLFFVAVSVAVAAFRNKRAILKAISAGKEKATSLRIFGKSAAGADKSLTTLEAADGADIVDTAAAEPQLEQMRVSLAFPSPDSSAKSGRSCCGSTKQWAMLKAGLTTPFKIMITYIQVVGQLTGQNGALQVKYPPEFQRTTSKFGPFVDAGKLYGQFFSADCIGHGSFNDKWVIKVLIVPMLMVLLVILAWCIERCIHTRGLEGAEAKRQATERRKENFMQRLFLVLFFVYPSVCKATFSAFNCVEILPMEPTSDDTRYSVLVEDDRVLCESSSHHVIQVLSSIVIIGFAVLLPVFFGVWLLVLSTNYSIREKSKKDKKDPTSVETTFEKFCLRFCCCCFKRAKAKVELKQSLLPSDSDERSISAREIAQEAAQDSTGGLLADKLENMTSEKQLAALQHLEAAIRDCTDLHDFAILIEAYSPDFVYWETLDMLRKLALVGLVILVGRGSVAQIAAGTLLSFGFFALHAKIWPLKNMEDNMLRACSEIHVLLTITIAFVIKIFKVSPETEQHELVTQEFYDWFLMITLLICLPFAFFVTLVAKYMKAKKKGLLRALDTPAAAFARYKFGFSSADDRRQLKMYFLEVQARVIRQKSGSRKLESVSDFVAN